jgi:hypothetical protein
MEHPELTGALAGVTYGRQIKPIFVCLYGPDGVGKSTFGASAPNPVFIGTESGSFTLEAARLPQPKSIGQYIGQTLALRDQPHPFESIIVDSLDWLEPLIWKQVCAEGKVETIEKYEQGYGKGYVRAAEIWRGVINELAGLAQRFHVILIAHSKIKKFDDPSHSAAYERYIIGINEHAAAVVRQAVDCVLFATFKANVKTLSKTSARGIGDGVRLMFSQHRPAFDAKNRFNLPFEMPLDWGTFGRAVKAFYDSPVPTWAPAAPEPTNGGNPGEPLPEPNPGDSLGLSEENGHGPMFPESEV